MRPKDQRLLRKMWTAQKLFPIQIQQIYITEVTYRELSKIYLMKESVKELEESVKIKFIPINEKRLRNRLTKFRFVVNIFILH